MICNKSLVGTRVLCPLRFLWLEMTNQTGLTTHNITAPGSWNWGAEREVGPQVGLARLGFSTAVSISDSLSSAGFSCSDKEAARLRRSTLLFDWELRWVDLDCSFTYFQFSAGFTCLEAGPEELRSQSPRHRGGIILLSVLVLTSCRSPYSLKLRWSGFRAPLLQIQAILSAHMVDKDLAGSFWLPQSSICCCFHSPSHLCCGETCGCQSWLTSKGSIPLSFGSTLNFIETPALQWIKKKKV